MRFVVTNFWSAPQSLNRRNLSRIRTLKPSSSQDMALPIIELIPLTTESGIADSGRHLSVNDTTALLKTA
ncbi:MAG: hypothetical protein WCB49_07280 [Gammaproteobacteria bacterium]